MHYNMLGKETHTVANGCNLSTCEVDVEGSGVPRPVLVTWDPMLTETNI